MRTLLILLACLVQAPAAWSWGQTGHRAAAEIATHYLSPEARISVEKILGAEALPRASTWPDFMRADPSEFWQETARPWHYVTVPEGKTYEEVGAPPEGDAYTALQRFRETLQDAEATRAGKALALRFTVHIVADLHQPMHVGNGTDRGGNDFEVTWFGEKSNLHRVWDTHIIEQQNLAYTELAAWLRADIDHADFRAWNEADPHVWMRESAELRDRVYPDHPNLRWDYSFAWRDDIYRRLSQAGVRTATWLNAVFARPTGKQAERR